MIHKYYLTAATQEIMDAALLDTLGATSSTREFTVVPVSEPLEIVGGTDEEPIYADPSGFVHVNVYTKLPVEWPSSIETVQPVTPWSDLA